MNLTQQKLHLLDKIAELQSRKESLKEGIRILEKGVEALNNGEDVRRGGTKLSAEVGDIMRGRLD